jgi:hypothetical protein
MLRMGPGDIGDVQGLEYPPRRRHGGFDDEAAEILPPLLKQRHEVVDSQHQVREQLVGGHGNVSHRYC